jgi:hypothetical protein
MIKIIIALICSQMLLAGCIFSRGEKNLYVGPNQVAEIAEPVRARVWIRDKETGQKELRTVKAQAGWYIGRMEVKE